MKRSKCFLLKDIQFQKAMFADDIRIAGSSEQLITEVKNYLDKLFTVKDLGVAKYFLGLEIARCAAGLAITQTKCIKDIVSDTGLNNAKVVTTPLPAGITFTAEARQPLSSPEAYRSLVGRLLYLSLTRPDISHASQQLSQFMQHPCKQHWDAAIHVVKYLKGTSHKGSCILLGTTLISWKTKKQTAVSRSTTEAEYRSMGSTVSKLLSTLRPIISSMSAPNTLKFIATSYGTSTEKGSFLLYMYPPNSS
ncbi:UNVERIFIED_CONTAM: Retrovirus-related Pol polyprotein from transposon RE1 [Sesamum latifolium]|uniref:Retrovirus-related Pol polyprotein from transposon RE1 n=1 Tax=Sesamum latifolium TaxID=2727402 RepID=A0AAW2V0Z5_9LAMI